MSFIEAIQNAFGGGDPVPDTTTMRGLIQYIRLWAAGKLDASPLPSALQQMQVRIDQAVRDQAADIEKNPSMSAAVRAPMEGMLTTYRDIAGVLVDLGQAVEQEAREAAARLADRLEACGATLKEHQAALDAWLQSPYPRCPRCGSGEQDSPPVCEVCGLDRLIPDADYFTDQSRRTAPLTPPFLAVHDAFHAVVEGREPLGVLLERLPALEQAVWEQQQMARTYSEKAGSTAAGRLIEVLERTRAGIERMRQVTESRAMRDLVEGWRVIFETAVESRAAARDLFAEVGEEDRAAIMEKLKNHPEAASAFRSLLRQEDTVVLEGD